MRYARASSVSDAVARLTEGAIVLAGGTVLVPELMRQGTAQIVDIGRLEALRGIRRDGDLTVIGALVTLEELALGETPDVLRRAAAATANPNVRRVGTVGGNVALGSRHVDLPTALLTMDAELVLAGPSGEEVVPFAAGVAAGRLVVAVRVRDRRAAFRKFAWRQASGLTLVNVAVSADRIAVGGICAKAQRLPRAEAILVGRERTPEVIEEVAAVAAEEAPTELDGPPGAAYRRSLIRAGVRQLLSELA